MPVCKNCGSRISKFDKDMCPVCGTIKPLEGVASETVEITSEIDLDNPDFKGYRQTKRILVFILFALCGFSGAGFFYSYYKKIGLFWLIINLVLFAGISAILIFLASLGLLWGFLIPLIIIYAINIIVGLYYLLKPNIKDGRGEYIR